MRTTWPNGDNASLVVTESIQIPHRVRCRGPGTIAVATFPALALTSATLARMGVNSPGESGEGASQTEGGQPVADLVQWEVPELRCELPSALRAILGTDASVLAVPINVRNKSVERHPGDAVLLKRID